MKLNGQFFLKAINLHLLCTHSRHKWQMVLSPGETSLCERTGTRAPGRLSFKDKEDKDANIEWRESTALTG